jgi:hypothetical protein
MQGHTTAHQSTKIEIGEQVKQLLQQGLITHSQKNWLSIHKWMGRQKELINVWRCFFIVPCMILQPLGRTGYL